MLIAALDTGMRQGEMLALRFADVDLARGLITLRGHTTKSGRSRVVPISTARLRDVLAWLRVDADGQPKPDEALVFSNEVGEPLRLFHRSWQTLVLRAHGHTATWAARLNYQGLSDGSQDTFLKINLRWHDLRHEYASRLVEQGVPLRRCATCSATRRSRRPSATTTRCSKTSSSPCANSSADTLRRDNVSRFFQDRRFGERGGSASKRR